MAPTLGSVAKIRSTEPSHEEAIKEAAAGFWGLDARLAAAALVLIDKHDVFVLPHAPTAMLQERFRARRRTVGRCGSFRPPASRWRRDRLQTGRHGSPVEVGAWSTARPGGRAMPPKAERFARDVARLFKSGRMWRRRRPRPARRVTASCTTA